MYIPAHPCNIKEFKVLVGLHENNMTEVGHEHEGHRCKLVTDVS